MSISKHENKVWYYQSGPKSVSINPYGIPEPPKPFRKFQSLNKGLKLKKFESLNKNGSFLNPVMGVDIPKTMPMLEKVPNGTHKRRVNCSHHFQS